MLPFFVSRPSLIFFLYFSAIKSNTCTQINMRHRHHAAPKTLARGMLHFSFLSFLFQIETKNPNCPTAMLTQCFVNIDDCFISHPLTAFCRWRASLRTINIDFLRYSLFMFICPNLITNLKRQGPQDVLCIIRSS